MVNFSLKGKIALVTGTSYDIGFAITSAFAFVSLLLFSCGGGKSKTIDTQEKELFTGYLFAYFEGSGDPVLQEQLRFGVSSDAVNWFALNGNRPIIPSAEIAQTGGIRDPYIMRGEGDDSFYIVATDMFTMKDGWDHNPGIIMLKSDDLINWKHSIIDLTKSYPEKFGNVKWVWAPQAIYDPEEEKYLIYFTIRFNNDRKLDFYSAYANEDFTAFTAEPTLMFSSKYGAIDGDIIYKDGIYHFFYKGNTKDENGREVKNGIQKATGKSLQGPWEEDFNYLDVYAEQSIPVEGSSIFKLNNEDIYFLMYDLYTSQRYEFQRTTDLSDFTQTPESFIKDFHPRHGSVISITNEEATRLNNKWGGVPRELLSAYHFTSNGNPAITHKFTPDPAAMVDGDTLWLFTGQDRGRGERGFTLNDWCVFSTTDFKNWTDYPTPLRVEDFAWDETGRAYAAQAIQRNGKYYWYISTDGSGIGVAVSDRPEGPYKDAIGKPLVTNEDCFASTHFWTCIDPTVFIDDDEQGWLFWGNGVCYYAKLKENMIELEGEIKTVDLDSANYTEAPWIHKYNGKYYLSYASGGPQRTAYAMADHIEGPYKYQGILNEPVYNSSTNHHSIVEFKGDWYYIYHNGAVKPDGSSFNRSTCIDRLYYNPDGTMKQVVMTSEGVANP